MYIHIYTYILTKNYCSPNVKVILPLEKLDNVLKKAMQTGLCKGYTASTFRLSSQNDIYNIKP